MSTTVNTGWIKDVDGNKFAPKTLFSQVIDSDGKLLTDLASEVNDKVNLNQGAANSGKVLGIGADGLVVPTEAAGLEHLGITATAEELNYMDGVTSNVQTQLNDLLSAIENVGNSSPTSNTLAVFSHSETVALGGGGTN